MAYGTSGYGDTTYGDGDRRVDFLRMLIDSMPPVYRPPEARDFIARFLRPSAEDLARINQTFDLLDTRVDPYSAPEDWLRWMLGEWMGWRLIPEGYPLPRLRRLLANLHMHYKRRYTVRGLRELLAEFGAIADVYDRPVYVRSWVGRRGLSRPLAVWVRVHYLEPWESPRRTYVRNYVGGAYAYRTRPLVTKEFVYALCDWARPAGTAHLIEFITRSPQPWLAVSLYGQPARLAEAAPITQGPHITEP